ncbi:MULTISPECIES: 3-oxoacyl-ACP reductase [unclassified Leuconostoc]|uniref:3-oxoacyl-ACP reductase n=1 Tax=unclassified Leuconostoc TaxID=2685106 RepID=UPI001905351D|nr:MULTISPECIES: 3-oxoacyl-ACP reductase [unclassified Leuconostoc]MBK0040070.1 3-oxoacyl-ACP reductase [Leuconostoc sp. S51]MBK0051028.1 3-oxoacyl-ACP reductase [Leuconostoc sp. S50]
MAKTYTNKNILITGAASGIGFSQMMSYLANGANVFAIDQQVIDVQHERLTTYQLDISHHDALIDLLTAITEKASIDVLVNTAGILDDYQPSLEINLENWQQVLDVNVTPMFITTNAVLPGMIARGSGHIVNMASIAGFSAGGGGAAYTTSKHAIIGYTKQLVFDYAKKGIHVNAIAPGAINTPMNAADFAGDGAMAKQVAEQTPAKRWATPQEVADLTLFLTSPQADYINGAVVPIDGGWSLGH